MELKKKEESSQLSTWIAASILLHLLILLVALVWQLESLFKFPYTTPKSQPIIEEDTKIEDIKQKMKLDDPAVTYQLIPGRKAVTEAQSEEVKPQDEPKPSESTIPDETQQPKPLPIELPKIPIPHMKSFKSPHDHLEQLKQQLKKQKPIDSSALEKTEIKPAESTKINEDPTIQKKKVTLQDLKLGFAKYLQEGNNDILIQHGTQTPDAQALKHITYNQQVARTMKEAITTHEQWHRITNHFGKRIRLNLTLDRAGKLLNMQILQGSSDALLDKITLESLHAIKLYPPVPKHIPDDPFTMPWTLLF